MAKQTHDKAYEIGSALEAVEKEFVEKISALKFRAGRIQRNHQEILAMRAAIENTFGDFVTKGQLPFNFDEELEKRIDLAYKDKANGQWGDQTVSTKIDRQANQIKIHLDDVELWPENFPNTLGLEYTVIKSSKYREGELVLSLADFEAVMAPVLRAEKSEKAAAFAALWEARDKAETEHGEKEFAEIANEFSKIKVPGTSYADLAKKKTGKKADNGQENQGIQ
jgi:hypothetical protein